ncbi:MAG: CRISPR-associated protein Csx3 [Chlorobi bacterium]|nr:CRISPR-associated protein Csx3 [Chlorobiota bacterium]
MASYHINIQDNDLLKVDFGDPAQNDRIVKDADEQLLKLIEDGMITGGELIRISGPASLPVAMVIAHRLTHLYQAVACYDPKMKKYVVAIAHGNKYHLGELLD